MRTVRCLISIGLAMLAISAFMAGTAGAETLRFSKTGQPIASGIIESEEQHGAIHCQAIAELLGETPKGGAPGVVVITPNGIRVSAPAGGECEAIGEIFGA